MEKKKSKTTTKKLAKKPQNVLLVPIHLKDDKTKIIGWAEFDQDIIPEKYILKPVIENGKLIRIEISDPPVEDSMYDLSKSMEDMIEKFQEEQQDKGKPLFPQDYPTPVADPPSTNPPDFTPPYTIGDSPMPYIGDDPGHSPRITWTGASTQSRTADVSLNDSVSKSEAKRIQDLLDAGVISEDDIQDDKINKGQSRQVIDGEEVNKKKVRARSRSGSQMPGFLNLSYIGQWIKSFWKSIYSWKLPMFFTSTKKKK